MPACTNYARRHPPLNINPTFDLMYANPLLRNGLPAI
jgi:hypothetical protein